jgi:hypothetical protein
MPPPTAEPGEAEAARTGTGKAHKHDKMHRLTVKPYETYHTQREGPHAE